MCKAVFILIAGLYLNPANIEALIPTSGGSRCIIIGNGITDKGVDMPCAEVAKKLMGQ